MIEKLNGHYTTFEIEGFLVIHPDRIDEKNAEIIRLTVQVEKLREALKRYVGKFGDCGEVYEQAKKALAETEEPK